MNKLEYSDKYQLIVKPTQSGKTFIVISEIKKLFTNNENKNDIRIINILFCDNSLLQTEQLKNRIDTSDISDMPIFEDIDGEFSVILSSKSNIKKYSCLFTAIFDDNCNNIITCANDNRIMQIDKLIFKRLKKNDTNTRFYIWIDESDKTFSNSKNTDHLERWNKYNNVQKIFFITATPEKHFRKQFDEINILRLDNSYDNHMYHLFCKSIFKYIDKDFNGSCIDNISDIMNNGSCIDNISDIMDKDNVYHDGEVWFVPGSIFLSSHEAIKSMLLNLGFYVFLINGECKALYGPNNQIISEITTSDNNMSNELSAKIGDLYEKYNLKLCKVAITGNLCISRGITISSKKMLITHGIIPPFIKDQSSAYQLVGRICGNFKHYPNFQTPVIYITEKMKNEICKMEEMAISICEKDKMSFDDYFRLKDDLYNVLIKDFTNINELIYFFNNNLKNHGYGTGPKKNRFTDMDSNGFLNCSIRGELKVHKSSYIIQNKRWGINKDKNKWRCHLGYDDLTRLESVKYFLIYIDPDELNDGSDGSVKVLDVSNNVSDKSNNVSDKSNNVSDKSNIPIKRPKTIHIFNKNTLLRHNTKTFTEYGIYVLNNNIYLCNENGVYDNLCESFASFNSFTVRNLKKYCPERTSCNNAYSTLDYYDNQKNKFIKMIDIKDSDMIN
jgi:hypothetical protein